MAPRNFVLKSDHTLRKESPLLTPTQPIMPSVAEQAHHSNFQGNVGNDRVCRSIIRVLSSNLTTETRFLIGSISGMTVPWWTSIIMSFSFLD